MGLEAWWHLISDILSQEYFIYNVFLQNYKMGSRRGVITNPQALLTMIYSFILKLCARTSLVVLWLRISLSMLGTWVLSLVLEDSICSKAIKPVPQKLTPWASTTEGQEPQLVKLRNLEPMLCNKRSHHTLQLKSSPQLLQLEKACAQQRRPNTAINKCVCVCVCARMLSLFSLVWLSAFLWTVALQIPLFMEISRQGYWNQSPCPLPGNLPDPGVESTSLTSPALASGFFTSLATGKAP